MTIMFAGGMTLAIPGFLPMAEILPEAYADQSTTVGMVTVSSTAIQGGQVLMVTINDPASSNPLVSQTAVTSDFNSSTLYFNQVTDGSWVAFVADQSTMLDHDGASSTSFDWGASCTTTHTGTEAGWTNGGNNTWSSDSTCATPGAGAPDAPMNNLADAPALILDSDGSGSDGPQYNGQTGIDEAAWPIITGFEMSSTNIITYGDDTVLVDWGPEEAGSDLIGPGPFVTQGQQLALTIVDNGLNIDPTTAETWTFTTSTTARTTGATTDIDSSLGSLGFGDNGILSVTDSDVAICADNTSGCSAAASYKFVESGPNTGVFEVHDLAGESNVDVKGDAGVDEVVTIGYGGNSITFAVATNNASATLDAGASWAPGEAAVYTITDPDMNRMAGSAETLDVSSDNVIPTIIIGSPKTLIAADIQSQAAGAGLNFPMQTLIVYQLIQVSQTWVMAVKE
jgi:hypothetical protein